MSHMTLLKAGRVVWSGTVGYASGLRDVHVDACGKNLNIVSMCAVSPVVHTSNISSCQKKQFSSGCEKFR